MQPPLKARLALVELIARNTLIAANITEPPVPASYLLGLHSVVHLFSHEFEEGVCVKDNHGQNHVFINRKMVSGRDNYTQAHELGHLLLDHLDIDQSLITEHHAKQIRREADYFAACVLMPESWIRSDCGDDTIGIGRLRRLIQRYDVSWAAMEIRLHELGICEREYIRWMWDQRKQRR